MDRASLASPGRTRLDAFAAVYEHSPNTIEDIRPEHELERLREDLETSPQAAAQQSGTWTHRCKDGRLIQVEISSHPLLMAGHKARFVFAHDVTSAKTTCCSPMAACTGS